MPLSSPFHRVYNKESDHLTCTNSFEVNRSRNEENWDYTITVMLWLQPLLRSIFLVKYLAFVSHIF